MSTDRLSTNEFDDLVAERDALKRKYAEECAIVDRVWKALGIKGYDEAKPYSIDEHVARLKAENTRLREALQLTIGFCVAFREDVPDWHRFPQVGVLFSKVTDALAEGKGE